ncbi:MAG TPA: hypothetical protein VJL80_06295 [Aeromicrobium sp.]|nr:hypothetical protein [Aeromicrobium sp.]HKY57629.1 hypothetical protein [Aeromicrobium sp.]
MTPTTEVPLDELEEIAFQTGALIVVDGTGFKLAANWQGEYQVFTAHKPVGGVA